MHQPGPTILLEVDHEPYRTKSLNINKLQSSQPAATRAPIAI